jgi:hypothetical protein
MNSDIVVELKDTMNTQRLNVTDDKFKSYLRQLLYYLVITGIEKGIISIKYNIKELKWIKSDSHGDYFFRPFNYIFLNRKLARICYQLRRLPGNLLKMK